MIGSLTSNNMHMLESSMEYLWTKQAVIADNVANAETPNYKAKYVTFEDAFQAQIRMAEEQGANRSEMRDVVQAANSRTNIAVNEVMRSDLNGVDVAEQEMEALRTNYQLQYVMNAITSDFSLLRAAMTP